MPFPFVTLRSIALAAVTATLAACATKATPYGPSIDNVEVLRRSGVKPIDIGSFRAESGAVGAAAISVRGASMESPVGSGYADYLAEALRQELRFANLAGNGSGARVNGVLLKNDISTGGLATHSGEIEARFIVERDGKVVYDRIKRWTSEWNSSLLAAVAVPRAVEQYPVLVQRLLHELFLDGDFVAACR